ncbi:MAG: hypothetical protein MUE67_00200 [Anaerolineales bacterium]|jgi:hypothetical protein|nr:hypothetical protein [Anaerolineales bacterium]
MRKSSLFWGGIIVLFGILLLIDELGWLSFSVWSILLPLLFIALGVWIIAGSWFGRNELAVEQVSVPLQSTSQADLRLRHAAGRLSISPGAAPGILVEGTCAGGVVITTRQPGDRLEVQMKVPDQSGRWMLWNMNSGLNWDLKLAEGIPLTLRLDSGAAEGHLDLSRLQLTDLRLHTGASSTSVTLPAQAGYTRAEFQTGAASLDLTIPAGVAARIRATGGLASINVDRQRFPRQAGAYVSPDYETAANKIDLQVNTGVGSVSIR